MISYEPLWQTMKDRGETTYTLIKKHGIDPKTIHKLKHNKNITMETAERICLCLQCNIQDIVSISLENVCEHKP